MKNMNHMNSIYCLCHKRVDYGLPADSLQCGAALNEAVPDTVPDNTGDNISELNPYYAENTGIYWIWKNTNGKIKGQYQYRRRLDLSEAESILKKFDVIACIPIYLSTTVYRQYCDCHNREDIDLCGEILRDKFPEYAEDWDRHILNGHRIYYSNGFAMKSDDYGRYCEFLFSILGEVWKRKGFNSIQDLTDYVNANPTKYRYVSSRGDYYQKQIGGFLAERLLTVFIKHNFRNVYEMPYTLMEKDI